MSDDNHTRGSDHNVAWNDGLMFLSRQATKDSRRWFPSSISLNHHTLGLVGEAGEVANIVKKIDRGSSSIDDPAVKEHLAEEVVDVLIYLVNLMGLEEFKDVDWMQVWYQKRQFNEERFGPARILLPPKEDVA